MAKRHKMTRSGSSHHFTKHASRTHKRNILTGAPMRGGIRL